MVLPPHRHSNHWRNRTNERISEHDLLMVRVLLALTHPLLRAALLEYLGAGEVLCEEAVSVEELWDQLRLELRAPQGVIEANGTEELDWTFGGE